MSDLNSKTHPAQTVRWKSKFFSLSGRATRKEFLLIAGIATPLYYLCYTCMCYAGTYFKEGEFTISLVDFIIPLTYFFTVMPVTVRRFHDLNKSTIGAIIVALLLTGPGCMSFLNYIYSFSVNPVVGFIGAILIYCLLGFWQGTSGENKYDSLTDTSRPDGVETKRAKPGLFSFAGRAGRAEFLLIAGIAILIYAVYLDGFLISYLYHLISALDLPPVSDPIVGPDSCFGSNSISGSDPASDLILLVNFILPFICVLMAMPVTVRRFHDLNKSAAGAIFVTLLVTALNPPYRLFGLSSRFGWEWASPFWYMYHAVSGPDVWLFVAILIYCLLGSRKGTPGENKYDVLPDSGEAVRSEPDFFSFEGRATRTEWWLTSIALSLLYLLGLAAFRFIAREESDEISAFILTTVLFVVFTIPVRVRRLHDRDMSGWWVLPFSLVGGLIEMIVSGFLEGTPGANRYGPSPSTPQDAKFKPQKLEKLYEKKMISAAKYEEEKRRLQAIVSGKPLPSQPPQAAPVTTPPATPVAPVQPAKSDSVEARLAKIKELREKGILSEEEYAEQRARIISEL